MKERPILFSAPMVLALLEGKKTQTRRIVKPPKRYTNTIEDTIRKANTWEPYKDSLGWRMSAGKYNCWSDPFPCPHGVVGDHLWVREAWQPTGVGKELGTQIHYQADGAAIWHKGYHLSSLPQKWRSSIHMFRWASRITLEITEVRVQRLQSISADDAIAEGIQKRSRKAAFPWHVYAAEDFGILWNKINGEGAWESNPWVWAITFQRLEKQ